MPSDVDIVDHVVKTIANTAIENEAYFCQLDSVVGDGDFGYSLARGFERLLEQWDELNRNDVSSFLKDVSVVASSRIGGSSGPIWGTGFLRAALVARKAETLDASTVVAMLRSAVEGIMSRGGAQLGDKTLLDVLVPLADTIEAGAAAGESTVELLSRAATRAAEAAEATKDMQAMRGRASYTGERSVGAVDAGATGIAVMVRAIADTWPADA
jgi:dihydroxyacetone kinase phosphoprotein-dependent L subunit